MISLYGFSPDQDQRHYPTSAKSGPLSITTDPQLSILFFGKNERDIGIVNREMTNRGFSPTQMDVSRTQDEFSRLLKQRRYDVILADHSARGADSVLTQATGIVPEIPFVFIGRLIQEEQIVALIRQGAADYVLKKHIGRLPFAVQQAVRSARLNRAQKKIEDELAFSLKHLEQAQHMARIASFEFYSADHKMVWSHEMFDLLGLDPLTTPVTSESALAVLEGSDRKNLQMRLTSVARSPASIDENLCFTHPGKGWRCLRLIAQSRKDGQTGSLVIIGTLQDVTEAKVTEEQAFRLSMFERDVVALSRNFINTPLEKIDDAISEAMKRIGEYCCMSWVSIYRYNFQCETAEQLYCWHRGMYADASAPVSLPLGSLNIPDHSAGEFFTVAPQGDTREMYVYPVFANGEPWGALACNAKQICIECLDNRMVGVFCEMLIAVLDRRERELALRSMSESNQLILNSISDGFCLIDEAGVILNISKGLACWLGRSAADCIGLQITDCLAQETDLGLKATRIAHWSGIFRTGKPVEFDDSKDGQWYNNHYYPVFKDGRVVAAALFSTNITAKKTAEEEHRKNLMLEKEAELLRKKEKEYLEILDGSTAGSWIFDVQSGVMQYSDQLKRRLGLEAELAEPLELYYDKLLHPDDKAHAIEESTRTILNGQTKYKVEYRIKTVDSGYMWVLAQGKVIYDGNIPVKIYGASVDITERKKAEEALRDNQMLLRMIIEGVSDLIYLKDKRSCMVMVNPPVERQLGLASDIILGKSDMDLLRNEQQAKAIIENDQKIMETGDEETIEEYVDDKVFLSKKAPWCDTSGKVIGLIGISRDITERIDLIKKLKQTAEELKQKNQLITDFFINVSHEFKTPLSIMMISTELVEQYLEQEEPDIPGIRRSIAYIRQNMFRLSRLVNNLLDITKIDAGFMQPRLTDKDIAGLLRFLVGSLQPYAEKKKVAIHFAGPQREIIIPTDTAIIDRIILNLVSNALKHTLQGGEICIRLYWLGDKVCIAVRDNGSGIPDGKKEIIFDRFRQVNTSLARSSEGCGIGLALVKSLAQMLGGRVWVESKQGHGSEFFIELPLLKETCKETIEVEGLPLGERIEMELSDIAFI